MPRQDTRSQIVRKGKLVIQLVREIAELLEASENPTAPQRPRYPRRSTERQQ